MVDEKIDIENETIEETNELTELEDITSRIHEIDLLLENYELVTYADDLSEEQYQEMVSLKAEYKELNKRLKSLTKPDKKTIWDLIPVWMMIYAFITTILVIFPITPFLPDYFGQAMVDIMPEAWHSVTTFWLMYALYYVIILGATTLIFTYIKKDAGYRKLYIYFFCIQGLIVVLTNLVYILMTVL